MNDQDDYVYYLSVVRSGRNHLTVSASGLLLVQIYRAMNDCLFGGFEWALYSIEHELTGEVLMCGRMTPEAWRVYGDSYFAFQEFINHFSPDFDERVNAALYGGYPDRWERSHTEL